MTQLNGPSTHPLPSCISQASANILHSLDAMGVQPGRDWLRGFAAATRHSLVNCSPHGLATMAGAMGRLWQRTEWHENQSYFDGIDAQFVPGAGHSWVSRMTEPEVLSRGAARNTDLPESAPRHLPSDSALIDWVWALIKTCQRRLAAQMAALAAQSPIGRSSSLISSRGGLEPEDLVCLALATPTLKTILVSSSSSPIGSGGGDDHHRALPDGWLSDLRAAMLQQMAAFNPTQLSNALMALARIHRMDINVVPGPMGSISGASRPIESSWLREWLLASAKLAPSFNASDVAQSLWALAALGASVRRPPTFHTQPHTQAPPASSRASNKTSGLTSSKHQPKPTDNADPLGSRSRSPLPIHVPSEWLSLFLSKTRTRMASMNSSQLSMTVWAVSAMGLRNPSFQVGIVNIF